jgi:hypothetical protein
MNAKPQISDNGTTIVVEGVENAPVTINDKKTLEELRALLAERRSAGIEITESLKSHGIHIAGNEETVVVST